MTYDTAFNNIQELTSLAITIEEVEESEDMHICLSSISDNIKFSSYYLDSTCL